MQVFFAFIIQKKIGCVALNNIVIYTPSYNSRYTSTAFPNTFAELSLSNKNIFI